MSSASFTPTPEQLDAIHATGGSVLVSAAAGSGKTAVLAERCAYLVCDASPEHRCNVDELLVLTFTEAAAAEMRERIVNAIRARARARPAEHRLGQQVDLADAAQISTIDAFCLWVVRRWFSELGIDPTAEVMDAEETSLLKREVLQGLFGRLYEGVANPADPLGADELMAAARSPASDSATRVPNAGPLAPDFARLVDDYGLGEDGEIADVVLRLFEFTTSLPDGDRWLTEAVDSLRQAPEIVLVQFVDELESELRLQADHCQELAVTLLAGHAAGHWFATWMKSHAERLRAWARELRVAPAAGDVGRFQDEIAGGWPGFARLGQDVRYGLIQFECLRRQIAGLDFERAPSARNRDCDEPAVKAAREQGGKAFGAAKDSFVARLRNRFALFSVGELAGNLARTAPYAETLIALVRLFNEAYTARKRRLNVLDFADLERFAFELLRDPAKAGDEAGPSEIARILHGRFVHVLVDEFQDINPLQQAILRLVSRETDPQRSDNLFAVGDTKQSIYRFRLAEPSLFDERLKRFRHSQEAPDEDRRAAAGRAIFLQSNFRSRPEILEAVNAIFRRLSGLGGMVYDADAELHPGRTVRPPPDPVEVHLLERAWEPSSEPDEPSDGGDDAASEQEGEEPQAGFGDPFNPVEWTAIELEAFLIGTRIREWLAADVGDDGAAPRSLRDIAVLLRATKFNADRVAAMLNAMGIAAFSETGGALFGAREIRDVVAALRVLDNPLQDVPIAAVLRSGVFGLRLSADELAEIRLLNRGIAFHEAVFGYAERGTDASLRTRVRDFVATMERFRESARRRSLSETLWRLYEEQGFLAYAAGLPNGSQRRANLLKLHDLARKFGSFRRQGLHRFLQFLESLEADERELDVAPVIGESDDVVRVMSIHQAKGLEFPLVFVAGLGSKFNLGDRRGRIIFERRAKIGLRVIDTQRMIEYPSAAHHLVVSEIERTAREEELRVLYVAMTRAREKLILVGSCDNLPRWREFAAGGCATEFQPTGLRLSRGQTPIDWLLPFVLAQTHSDAGVSPAADRSVRANSAASLFRVQLHAADEIADWRVGSPREEGPQARKAAARLDPLPSDEPIVENDAAVEAVLARMDSVYPHAAATALPATAAAGQFKGTYDFLNQPDFPATPAGRRFAFDLPPSRYAMTPTPDAAYRGVVMHRVLQHLDFAEAEDSSGLARELQRLVLCGVLTAQDRGLVDVAGLCWFVSTSIGRTIREAGPAYRRELRFVSTEPLEFFDGSIAARDGDHVLVRGIVDGIIVAPDFVDVVDFKTDDVAEESVVERSAMYHPQMTLYGRALSRMFQTPVRNRWLVFLTARQIVPVPP